MQFTILTILSVLQAFYTFTDQIISVAQSCPTLCDPMNRSTPGLLSITNSWSSLRLTSIESVMPSSHLILCCSLLLLPPIPPSIRVFSSTTVQFSRSAVSDSLRPHESQHARPPVHHQLLELTQTHIHRVSDAIQPSHPLSSPSPPAPNPSQHQSLFQ